MEQDSQQEKTEPINEPGPEDLNLPPDFAVIKEQLLAPFDIDLVELLCASTSKTKATGLAVAYVDKRAYEDRLDSIVGFENWQSHYEPWGESQIICHLTILGITKSDVGEADPKDRNTATSAVAKGFKRACSCFGLGRYLYSLPKVWGDMDDAKKRFLSPEKLVREIYMRAGIVPSGSNGDRPPRSEGASPPSRTQSTTAREKPAAAPKDETLSSATPAELRDHSGEAIFRSGWVEKVEMSTGTVFRISMHDVADKVWAIYTVSKNRQLETVCECQTFKEGRAKEGPAFKCQCIYAVVHFLKQTAAEAGEKASPTSDAAVVSSTYQGDPLGTTTANLIEPKRLGMISAICRGGKLDANAECLRLLKCRPEDLSKDAADWFIEQLKVLAAKPVGNDVDDKPQVSVSMSVTWNCTPATQRKLIHHWEQIVAHPGGMSDEEMRDTFRSQYDDQGAPESLDEKTASSAELRLKGFLDKLKMQDDQDKSKPTGRHKR